jgi:hypothetical protein
VLKTPVLTPASVRSICPSANGSREASPNVASRSSPAVRLSDWKNGVSQRLAI